jgi:FtsP/CotA-like multicopper oxidase with cupredoxin domain
MNVGTLSDSAVVTENLGFEFGNHFTWTINSTSLVLDWEKPTTLRIFDDESIFPTEYNVEPVEITTADPVWAVYVIQDLTGIGLSHPIHLHGHDFWIIAQDTGVFDAATTPLNLINPPRRDVASLPGNGYLAIAFKKDNPGSWLLHCHVSYHHSEFS